MEWTKGSSDGMEFKGTYGSSFKACDGTFSGSFSGTGGVAKGVDSNC